jgi:protein-S-isoprenylcysteine O-methyltransferase Ste14
MKLLIVTFGLLYLGVLVGWRGYRVWKQIGMNPLMLKATDDVGGYVVRACKGLSACMFLVGVIYCAAETSLYRYLFPIEPLERSLSIRWMGYILCAASLVWIYVAQSHMGSSWRVGIDAHNRTMLVTDGLYRFSRNPIFFGMIVSFVGVFLVLPNATLLALVLSFVFMLQVQVRLEEDHLRRMHGDEYAEFQRRVPRWVLLRPRRDASPARASQKETCAPVTNTLP